MIGWLCGELNVDKAELLSQRRGVKLVQARKVVICFLRDLGWSYLEIGRTLKRNHTSVINLHHKSDVFTHEWAETLRTKWELRDEC